MTTPAEEEIVSLESDGWRALATGPEAAERFYRDLLRADAVMVFPGGMVVSGREQILESMSGEPWASFELDDMRVLRLGADAALVSYRATARRNGQPEYRAWCVSCYAGGSGQWTLAFHQQTPA